MRERPILFSTPMVRAILAGKKTQTRRLVEPQPIERKTGIHLSHPPENKRSRYYGSADHFRRGYAIDFPRFPIGRKLWVKETWGFSPRVSTDGHARFLREQDTSYLVFRADGGNATWRSAMLMPRWASRITLEVTDVRVERLQSISEDDAKAEGVTPLDINPEQPVIGVGYTFGQRPYSASFACLWDELNDTRAPWSSNPWVWVVSFKRLEA